MDMAMVMVMLARPRSFILVQKSLLFYLILGGVVFPSTAAEWKITPSISVNETATDNVALTSSNKKSDLITDLAPGIRIEGRGGRSKLNFNYQMHNLIYAQDSSRNRTQNSLNAQGTLEAVDNWLFIDASGAISQQSVSAFGGATSADVNANTSGNTTETSTYRVSPYIQGSFGRFADYQLRYSLTTNSSKANQAFDSDSSELTGTLSGDTGLASLGWSLNASSQTVDFGNGGSNEADRLQARLIYRFDPQFRVSVFAGREANNYLTLDKQGHTTKGAGIDWAPTERTSVSVSRENRFFGNSNSFSLSHRTAGTAWRYLESKDATVSPRQQSSFDLTVADLARSICSGDTTCETTFVAAFPPGTVVPAGFLSSGATLQQRREFSFAILGVRNSISFLASQSQSQRLGQQSLIVGSSVGDYSVADTIRQRIASVSWSHKLTPTSSLTGNFSRTNSLGTGTGTSTLETNQRAFNINFSTQLGPNTSAGVGARRVIVDGSSNYTENALTGVLSHRF